MLRTRIFKLKDTAPIGCKKFPEFQTRKGVGDFAASALLRMIRGMLIQLHPSRRASAANLPTAAVLGVREYASR